MSNIQSSSSSGSSTMVKSNENGKENGRTSNVPNASKETEVTSLPMNDNDTSSSKHPKKPHDVRKRMGSDASTSSDEDDNNGNVDQDGDDDNDNGPIKRTRRTVEEGYDQWLRGIEDTTRKFHREYEKCISNLQDELKNSDEKLCAMEKKADQEKLNLTDKVNRLTEEVAFLRKTRKVCLCCGNSIELLAFCSSTCYTKHMT